MTEELARTGWETASTFTVGDGPRPSAGVLAWWQENTPDNETADTKRSVAYLRAYLRIGGPRLYAGGLFLDRRRLYMDRSVISRLERDGYLCFSGEDSKEHYFELTPAGAALVAAT
ncbi:hypothetical protein [uncultured Sphingomonas sp.]|uniref:hypothetical protein n=1 Tax=uncultured Sphingomonas sp. TaxID=158754 RepID=UPI0035CB171F